MTKEVRLDADVSPIKRKLEDTDAMLSRLGLKFKNLGGAKSGGSMSSSAASASAAPSHAGVSDTELAGAMRDLTKAVGDLSHNMRAGGSRSSSGARSSASSGGSTRTRRTADPEMLWQIEGKDDPGFESAFKSIRNVGRRNGSIRPKYAEYEEGLIRAHMMTPGATGLPDFIQAGGKKPPPPSTMSSLVSSFSSGGAGATIAAAVAAVVIKVGGMIMDGGNKAVDLARNMTGILRSEERYRMGTKVGSHSVYNEMREAEQYGFGMSEMASARTSFRSAAGTRRADMTAGQLASLMAADVDPSVAGRFAGLAGRHNRDDTGFGYDGLRRATGLAQASGLNPNRFIGSLSDSAERAAAGGVRFGAGDVSDIFARAMTVPELGGSFGNRGLINAPEATLGAITSLGDVRIGNAARNRQPLADLAGTLQYADVWRQVGGSGKTGWAAMNEATSMFEDPSKTGFQPTMDLLKRTLGNEGATAALGALGNRTDISRGLVEGLPDQADWFSMVTQHGRGTEHAQQFSKYENNQMQLFDQFVGGAAGLENILKFAEMQQASTLIFAGAANTLKGAITDLTDWLGNLF